MQFPFIYNLNIVYNSIASDFKLKSIKKTVSITDNYQTVFYNYPDVI